jgi:hypothetical protein
MGFAGLSGYRNEAPGGDRCLGAIIGFRERRNAASAPAAVPDLRPVNRCR